MLLIDRMDDGDFSSKYLPSSPSTESSKVSFVDFLGKKKKDFLTNIDFTIYSNN